MRALSWWQCYLVDLREAAPEQQMTVRFGPTPFVNGVKYLKGSSYAASFSVGSVVEFALSGTSLHPFHLHINPFQILEDPPDTVDGYFLAGDWHDTLQTPNYRIDVRTQYDKFTGPQVFHCHDLRHEDEGMMGVIDILGTEGTLFTRAEAIDSTCVRERSIDSPTILSGGTCSRQVKPLTSLCFEADCEFEVSFRESPFLADRMEVTISYRGDAWLGLGVSPDGNMGPEAIAAITTWRAGAPTSNIYRLDGRTAEAVTSDWLGPAEILSATREGGTSSVVMNVPHVDRSGRLVHAQARRPPCASRRRQVEHLP